ncbi:MAG: DNA polymerase III subunit beta [Proteobacteria bacterium]|nr:DNA polymerase III subunit beta [Pseudomonadota bacterium]
MQLTIERGNFLKTLGHVQSIVERRNTIPILSNVQIEAEGGIISLTATDLDLSIVEKTEADIKKGGAITVPAHTMFDIVRKLPEGAQIELKLGEDNRLQIKAGRSDFNLAGLPKEDFPVMSEGDMPHKFTLTSASLKKLMDKTRFAISTEETRYYLNGIYLHVVDDGKELLRAVSTDGHRMARVETKAPKGSKGMPGVIIPRKTVSELRKLIEEFDGDVKIALSDTKIKFSFDSTVLTSKLIDGTFPDYKRVIPTANEKKLSVDGHVLAEAVDRVSTISTERTRSVKLSLGKDTMVLSVNSPESGTATEEVSVSYSAEPMEIGFNARYLLDILHQIEGDTVNMELADSASPTLIRDSGDADALYVLMPMRV